MDAPLSLSLPKFIFPKEFESGLPRKFTPYTATPSERDKIMNAILSFRSTNMEYMTSEKIDYFLHGTLRDTRKYEDGTLLARVETWTYTSDQKPDLPYQIVMRLNRELALESYTIYLNRMCPEDDIYVRQPNYGFRSLPLERIGEICDALGRLKPGARIDFGCSQCTLWNFYLVRQSSVGHFDVSVFYPHTPYAFRAHDVHLDAARRLLTTFATQGYAEALATLDWQVQSTFPAVGNARRIGVKLRLLMCLEWCRYKGELEIVNFLTGLGIDRHPSPPLWITLHQADWPVMIDELVDIAVQRPESGPEQNILLAFAALNNSDRARRILRTKCSVDLKPLFKCSEPV